MIAREEKQECDDKSNKSKKMIKLCNNPSSIHATFLPSLPPIIRRLSFKTIVRKHKHIRILIAQHNAKPLERERVRKERNTWLFK
jgi:hypothetical protein